MASPILSLVIPAYNMEPYLERCLASIADADSLEALDVMVVDDGGTDGSLSIAQDFERRYPQSFRAIHKENGGHGSVINYGIEYARGTYFKVIDGDDWVDSNALDALVELLQHTDADIVLSDYDLIADGTDDLIERRRSARDASSYGKVHPIEILKTEEIVKIHSLTVRTALLRENSIRVSEGCFYEDAEFSIYPLAFAKTVVFDDHAVYQYRIGRPGQSVDIERLKRNHDQHTNIIMELLAFRDAHAEMDAERLDAIDRAIAYYTQNQYQIYLSLGNNAETRKSLKDFDRLLRNDYPTIYQHATKSSIWLIRKTGYAAFPLGCLVYQIYRLRK